MSKVVKFKCRDCKRIINGRKVKMGSRPVLAGSIWATCRDCRDAPICAPCGARADQCACVAPALAALVGAA